MLDFTLQQYPLRFGLDEGTDPNQQPPGQLVTAENVEWVKGGRLQKRDGIESVSISLGAGKRFMSRGDELCATDGTSLYSLSTHAGWRSIDRVPDVAMTWETSLDTYDGISSSDAAKPEFEGYIVQAWRTGAPNDATRSIWVRVIDSTSGTQVIAPTNLSTTAAVGVRVLVDGDTAYILWREGANIKCKALDLTVMAFSLSAGVTLRSDARATSGFDACIIDNKLIIAYETTGNLLKLFSYSYNVGTDVYTNVAAGIVVDAGNDFRKIAITGTLITRIYVAYYVESTDLIRVATMNSTTLAPITAPVTQESGAGLFADHVVVYETATGAIVGWSYETSLSAGPVSRFTTCAVSSTCVQASGSLRGTWGTRLLSRIFAQGTRYFAFVTDYPSASFTSYTGVNSYLLEIDTSEDLGDPHIPHRFVGRLDLLVGGAADYGFLPSAVTLDTTETLVPVPFLSSSPQTVANFRCGLRHVRVTTGASLPADMWRSTEFGGESYLSGGLFSAYDGRVVFDYGISRGVVVGARSNLGGGGSIAAGDYLYGFVEEWRSNAGVLHRSVTASTTETSAASGTTTIWVLTSALSNKRGDIAYATAGSAEYSPQQVVTFRSDVGGEVYYRLTYEPNYNTTTKAFQSSFQTITDTRADSDIGGTVALTTRPLIYTTGGILDDDPPPNLITHALHKSRLWGVAGDRRTIWFSKSFLDDLGVAPGFSPSFRITMDEDVNAIWTLDEKAIVASDESLWFLLGGEGGPAPTGQGSDIQGPIRIQTEVGCTNPRSVVGMPDGTMFEGDGRIYLLTRALEVVWIGRQVQDTLDAYPNITSATLVQQKTQVRFTCNNDDGDEHVVLVFDYSAKQWTTFRYLAGGVAIADARMHDGQFYFLTTAGQAYRETSTVNGLDAGSWVPMTLETAWISAAGPLAFQSVRRFALHGTSLSDHALTVSVGYDRASSYTTAVAWAGGSAVTSAGPLEAAELHLGRKCSSVRFKIVDATPGSGPSDGRGPAFDSMGIEVGVKKGFQKKPATKRG